MHASAARRTGWKKITKTTDVAPDCEKTENTAAGCLHACLSPVVDQKGKRKISFATVTKIGLETDVVDQPERCLIGLQTDQKDAEGSALATVNSKKAKKRRRSEVPRCGNLGVLPTEIIEEVLEKCGARELGAMACVAKFFKETGIVERVAKKRVDAHPRADGIAARPRERLNSARLLHFAESADIACRTAAGVDLGAFHTAVLGIASAVSGPRVFPARRRTEARDFARRRGVGDDDFDVRDEDDFVSDVSNGTASESLGSLGTAAKYSWGPSPAVSEVEAASERARAVETQPRGRTLYTFGRGFHGQLGQGGYDDATRPSAVSLARVTGLADVGAIETIRCGASHCAALDPTGVLFTWGLASSGELGHGGWTPIEVDVPRVVSSMSAVRVTQVAAGANHTVAVSESGGLWTCGRGRHGQLGHGHFHDAGPLRRLEALRGMRAVTAAAGGSHSLCLTDCGSVWSWGACAHGQLGLGNVGFATAAGWETGVPWPCLVESLQELDEPVVTVSAGGSHTLFVTAGGQLWGCGRGEHGALGVGVRGSHFDYYYYEEDQVGTVRGPKDHLTPRLIPVHHKPKPKPSRANGSNGSFRREGNDDVSVEPARGSVAFLFAAATLTHTARKKRRDRRSMRASCGGPFSNVSSAPLASKPESFGAGGGSGVSGSRLPLPGRGGWIKAPCSCGATCRVVHAVAGGNHSAVLTACGAVMTTGSNAYGQLGLGDSRRRFAFERVEGLRGARLATVAVGEDHTGAVAEDGRLFLWGRGDWGQLGTGDARSHWAPRLVRGVSVAPPVPARTFLGFRSAEAEAESEDDEDPLGEMGGRNQHDVADAHAATAY